MPSSSSGLTETVRWLELFGFSGAGLLELPQSLLFRLLGHVPLLLLLTPLSGYAAEFDRAEAGRQVFEIRVEERG